MSPFQQICKTILEQYIAREKVRDDVRETIKSLFNFIPINSRYKIRKAEIFIEIAEACKLSLNPSNFRLMTELIEELGGTSVRSHGYKYWKGIVSKRIELKDEHTKIIHSLGSRDYFKLAKKGKINAKADM